MGRSVYVPSGAAAVVYFHWSPIHPDEDDQYFGDPDMLIDDIRDALLMLGGDDDPALDFVAEHGWHGREGQRIAESTVVTAVLAEYCGVWALSLVPVEEPDDGTWPQLRDCWEEFVGELVCRKIEPAVREAMHGLGLDLYRKLGSMSNGESVYQRIPG